MSRIVEPGPVEMARYALQLEAERDRLQEMLGKDPDIDWPLMAELVFNAEAARDTEKLRADSLQKLQIITQRKLEDARLSLSAAYDTITQLEAKVRDRFDD